MTKVKKVKSKFLIISLILLPITVCLYIVSLFSNNLINKPLSIVMLILSIIFFVLLVIGIILKIKNKSNSMKLSIKIVLSVVFIFYYACACLVMVLLYGPNDKVRSFLITSAMTTMEHQYFATWFYNDEIISKTLGDNVVVETNEEVDLELVTVGNIDFNKIIYKNEYEEQVLTKEEGNNLYKIINIDRDGYKAKLAVIYDPSKVILGVSKYIGTSLDVAKGQMLVDMSKRYDAVIGINASGFVDPVYNSTGGVPRGFVISQGKLIVNNVWGRGYGGMVGFDSNNKLVLSTSMNASQALANGIRDAIQYGPFLIVNGKASFIKGNGGWGIAPRTAIGQREDGIVLLLAVDGRQAGSLGVDMGDLTQIMLDYGAVNAVNMDGGTSTAMSLNHKLISNPRNGAFQPKTRPIPDGWFVLK